MTKALFHYRLICFDLDIICTSNKEAKLTLDNYLAHDKVDFLSEPKHVIVEFLHLRTTYVAQSLYAGIIAWVKLKYRKHMWPHIFDNVESGSKNIFIVDLLTASRLICVEWQPCIFAEMSNCFADCFKTSKYAGINSSKRNMSYEIIGMLAIVC